MGRDNSITCDLFSKMVYRFVIEFNYDDTAVFAEHAKLEANVQWSGKPMYGRPCHFNSRTTKSNCLIMIFLKMNLSLSELFLLVNFKTFELFWKLSNSDLSVIVATNITTERRCLRSFQKYVWKKSEFSHWEIIKKQR